MLLFLYCTKSDFGVLLNEKGTHSYRIAQDNTQMAIHPLFEVMLQFIPLNAIFVTLELVPVRQQVISNSLVFPGQIKAVIDGADFPFCLFVCMNTVEIANARKMHTLYERLAFRIVKHD